MEVSQYKSLLYSLLINIGVEFIGGILFFITAIYIVKDKLFCEAAAAGKVFLINLSIKKSDRLLLCGRQERILGVKTNPSLSSSYSALALVRSPYPDPLLRLITDISHVDSNVKSCLNICSILFPAGHGVIIFPSHCHLMPYLVG